MVSTFLTPNTWIPGSGFFTVQGYLTITTPFASPQAASRSLKDQGILTDGDP